MQPAFCQIETAHDDGQHVVKIVRDPTCELANCLHLLDLAQLLLGCGPLGAFRAEPPIGFFEFRSALLYRLLERLRAHGFILRILACNQPFADRLIGNQAEGYRANADQHADPAQPFCQLIRLCGEHLRVFGAPSESCSFPVGDRIQLPAQRWQGR